MFILVILKGLYIPGAGFQPARLESIGWVWDGLSDKADKSKLQLSMMEQGKPSFGKAGFGKGSLWEVFVVDVGVEGDNGDDDRDCWYQPAPHLDCFPPFAIHVLLSLDASSDVQNF